MQDFKRGKTEYSGFDNGYWGLGSMFPMRPSWLSWMPISSVSANFLAPGAVLVGDKQSMLFVATIPRWILGKIACVSWQKRPMDLSLRRRFENAWFWRFWNRQSGLQEFQVAILSKIFRFWKKWKWLATLVRWRLARGSRWHDCSPSGKEEHLD